MWLQSLPHLKSHLWRRVLSMLGAPQLQLAVDTCVGFQHIISAAAFKPVPETRPPTAASFSRAILSRPTVRESLKGSDGLDIWRPAVKTHSNSKQTAARKKASGAAKRATLTDTVQLLGNSLEDPQGGCYCCRTVEMVTSG